ncbi:Dienelactone hydrolase family [Fimbriimonas ginsengisoli Gsoil 348]|uniref:Dienelactone hydrolase family n=2 Tax=Fimbriimonas ginsengisoli TaxID=1005039 RepID=A0A068NR92_FIMGI|nr:Dienelactone hydrolase family [Fimbriimonas ginsengisoli Gsoil 348]
MSSFAADPAFVAAHLAPLPMRFAARAGKNVSFRTSDGKTALGFYVPPARKGAPGIVMVHEWWGLNDYIRREAERLHDELGYGVLAVDLYEGKVATTPQEAGKLMQAVRPDRAKAIVHGAVNALKDGELGNRFAKVGSIGWCFGGGWSLQAAIQGGPAVKACVMYYGMPDTDPADLKRLKAPVLLVWATRDGWINKGVVDGFKTAMANAKKPLTVLPFDADHGFANPSNPKYDKVSGDKAWQATISFYKTHLGK